MIFFLSFTSELPTNNQHLNPRGREVNLLPHQNKSSPLSHVLWNKIKLHLINEILKKIKAVKSKRKLS